MLTKGKITAHELKKVGQELGENMSDDEWNHVFNKADLDDDGFVTADDFYNIMTHKVYWEQWCCTFDAINIQYLTYLSQSSFYFLSSFSLQPLPCPRPQTLACLHVRCPQENVLCFLGRFYSSSFDVRKDLYVSRVKVEVDFAVLYRCYQGLHKQKGTYLVRESRLGCKRRFKMIFPKKGGIFSFRSSILMISFFETSLSCWLVQLS